MHWLLTDLLQFLAVALGLFLLAALLAPFESLGWWAGWGARWPAPVSLPAPTEPPPDAAAASCYLVFLSGVGITDVSPLTPKEQHFLDLLEAQLPGAQIVRDIFPYSAVNNPLTGRRPMRGFWVLVKRAIRHRSTRNLFQLATMRNVLQVAVSADRRYGPVLNFGVARGILLGLLRCGYRPDRQAPLFLIGLSGSGQIAVGSGAFLHRLLGAPVRVISIGGVLTSDPSILEIAHVYHLAGGLDRTQHIGQWLYPGCWPIARGSAWNRALALGRRTVIPVGPMRHMRHGDYFTRSLRLENGLTYAEQTAAVVAAVIADVLAREGAADARQPA